MEKENRSKEMAENPLLILEEAAVPSLQPEETAQAAGDAVSSEEGTADTEAVEATGKAEEAAEAATAGDNAALSADQTGKENQSADASAQEENQEAQRVSDLSDCFGSYDQTMKLLGGLPDQSCPEGFRQFASAVEGYARGKGIVKEGIDKMLCLLFSIGHGCRHGCLTLAMAEILLKGIDHDRMVSEKERAAELRGRNAAITEHMRRPQEGDGVPGLGGNISLRRRSDRGIFSLAEDAR